MKVNLFLTNKNCLTKLKLVKTIKDFSEPTMGLKEAKWLVDDLFDNVGICTFNIKNGKFNELKELVNSMNIGIKTAREEKLKRILDPRESTNFKKNKNTLHFIFDDLIVNDSTDKMVFDFEEDFKNFNENYNLDNDTYNSWDDLALNLMSRSFITLLKIFKPYMERNNITIDEFIRTVNRQLRNK